MDHLEIKAELSIDAAGTITGNAWPFGSADSVGDIITKGAINVAVDTVPMLFGHDPSDLIGTWSETTQTDDGFIVKGQLHLDQPRARAVRGLIQGGLVSGLSIGFRTREAKQSGRNRIISALDLLEISVVRNPSHPRARDQRKAIQFGSGGRRSHSPGCGPTHRKELTCPPLSLSK